ncbi:hypothetical protein B0H66DRAFT_608548 [Apodospora peruviana]|uniref:Uncharacterized protein n=1 Tax=Apodospora peruviana TaxID=516989 RepID=A0AAE0HT84_9PEZI|nr:hypothetical protein B0H66DRAFT_608548 [Apodospora peruviana]
MVTRSVTTSFGNDEQRRKFKLRGDTVKNDWTASQILRTTRRSCYPARGILGGSKPPKSKLSRVREIHLAKVADLPPKKQWEDAWTRKTVEPEEVQECDYCNIKMQSIGQLVRHLLKESMALELDQLCTKKLKD